MNEGNNTTDMIGEGDWPEGMPGGVLTKEGAASLLMTVSLLAEDIALSLSAEHALRTRESITKKAAKCKRCYGVCLCGDSETGYDDEGDTDEAV